MFHRLSQNKTEFKYLKNVKPEDIPVEEVKIKKGRPQTAKPKKQESLIDK